MSPLVTKIRGWLESRGSGLDRLRAFVTKPVPRNVGWIHTLGSLLLVYLGFQALSGILLGLYYSPSPDHAHDSVRYIREDLFLGAFLLNLHRWGAGFVLVTAFLHAARSYFLAAYKSPRELLWLTGLAAGALLTLFAFTGQLLPYDQRGYWASVVGIEIASSAPVAGGFVRDLLTGGYGDIGAVTLSRFYLLHVGVLPVVLLGIVALHLGILQRVGSAGPTRGSSEPTRPFFPSQMVKDTVAAAAGALALFLVAALTAYHQTGPADPASSDFVPRPEWYFLAHYEILRYLPGDWQILGTFVLPNLLLGALVLLPFFDRKPERSLARRKIAVGAGIVTCLAIVVLTGLGIASAPDKRSATADDRDPVARGRELFHEKRCDTCHSIGGEGGDKGPALDLVGRRLRPDFLTEWIRNPQRIDPTTEMPPFEGTEEELQAVVSYLLTLEEKP